VPTPNDNLVLGVTFGRPSDPYVVVSCIMPRYIDVSTDGARRVLRAALYRRMIGWQPTNGNCQPAKIRAPPAGNDRRHHRTPRPTDRRYGSNLGAGNRICRAMAPVDVTLQDIRSLRDIQHERPC
jgi:hypothetical protein